MPGDLRVLSLNTWGLTFTADYKERMLHIFNRLKNSNYDIVVLQEVFVSADINRLLSLRKHNYPYVHHFYSGFVGTGLMVLSKYPILDVLVFPYFQSGMVYHRGGDWFSKKSVCYCVIRHPESDIMVFGTHTHAKYAYNHFDELRSLQLFQLAKIVKTISRGDFPVVLAGDLNTESFESCFLFLLRYCNLKDACAEVHLDACDKFHTCNQSSNPYGEAVEESKRIDYILYNDRFVAKKFCYDFETDKSKGAMYSDHSGVAATLEFVSPDSNKVLVEYEEVLDSLKLILERGYEYSTVNKSTLLAVFSGFAFIFIGLVTVASLGLVTPAIGSILSGLSGIALALASFSLVILYISRTQQKRAYKNALREIDMLEESFID